MSTTQHSSGARTRPLTVALYLLKRTPSMPILSASQIGEVLTELSGDERIQGILLTGSYVYGAPNENSDLDIRCITCDGSDWAEFERMRFGVRVEVFFNPPEKVREFMELSRKAGHGDCIHFWANGSIKFDPSGQVELLQKEARTLWQGGPPSGGQWELRFKRVASVSKV